MPGTCKNCVFWQRDIGNITIWGSCNNEHFVDVSGDTGDGPFAPEDGVGFTDAEGYEANFFTGEAFGCIHFKQKED